jgi:orotate phosphoribosyltransferase
MKNTLLEKALCTVAYREGNFALAGGIESDHYWDVAAAAMHPLGHQALSTHVGKLVDRTPGVNMVAGPELGAMPLVFAALQGSLNVRYALIIREERERYGAGGHLVGPAPGWDARCLLMEDVVTTGVNLIKTAVTLRQEYPKVEIVGMHALILQAEQQDEVLENFEKLGVPFDFSFLDAQLVEGGVKQ